MSPAASILVCDFWMVRRTKWNIPDLYTPGGIYWFWNGLNWRAFTAYILGMVWALPGFIQAMGGPEVGQGWYRAYQLCFFVSYAASGSIFYLLNLAFPPPELGRQVDIDVNAMTGEDRVVHGQSVESKSEAEVETKDMEKGFRETVV